MENQNNTQKTFEDDLALDDSEDQQVEHVESVKPKVQPKDRFKTPYGKREVEKPIKIGSDLLRKLVPRKPARFS